MRTVIILSLVILFSQMLFGQTLSFDPPKIFNGGFNAHMLVTADFNNDGLTDIATANNTGDDISILLAVEADSFASEVLYTAGDGAFDIVAGDFNNDSNIDLAVTNRLDDSISVFMGVGDGTFNAAVNYVAGTWPKGIVAGLFNSDTILDLAVANDLTDNISIFIGVGDGTFIPKVDYVTGDRPHGLLMGLIDQDGELDLITINRNASSISVLRGNGDGSFQAKVDFAVLKFPEFATLGYFNGDTLLDIAVCNSFTYDSISILLGDTGTIFQTTVNYFANYIQYDVTSADFNLDSKVDLAITHDDMDSISILLGNGDGSFQSPFIMVTGNRPYGIISGDIDNDSDIDILNVNSLGGGNTYLFLNSVCPSITIIKNDATVVDLNNGSATAIVTGGLRPYTYLWSDTASQTDSTATGLIAGTYTVTVSDSLGCNVTSDVTINNPTCSLRLSLTKSDVSAIGGSDGEAIVTPVNGTTPYTYLWNDSLGQTDSTASALVKGTYQVIVTDSIGCIDTGSMTILELPCINETRHYSNAGGRDVDFCYINNDSIIDFATLNSVGFSTDKVNIVLGNGDGSFTYHSSFTVGTGGDQPTNIEVNDFNGDTINDIVVTVPDGLNGIRVYLGNGDGTFQPGVDYWIGSRPWDMVSFDFDHDGDVDLLICREQGDDVRMVKNNGSAVFSASGSKSVGSNAMDIEAGHLNSDTLLDLVVVNKLQASISVLLGNFGAYFSNDVLYVAGINPMEATLGDFNNDTVTDIAVSGNSPDRVYVFINNGDGSFAARTEYVVGNGPRGISTLDMNGDSNLDLVISNMDDSTLLIMLGDGTGVFDSTMKYPLNTNPFTSAVADIEDDGDNDLIITLNGKDSVAIINNCLIENCLFLFEDSTKAANANYNNGYGSITALGAATPFTYQWDDTLQQTSISADSLFGGTYKVVVTDSAGCKDSIIIVIEDIPCVLDTTVNDTAICQGDSILFGGTYRSATGVYSDSFLTIYGCDSVFILDLTVNLITTDSITDSICDSYTVPSGDEIYFVSGIYSDTIPNIMGCDSLLTINVTIYQSTSDSITDTVCGSYTVPSGDETHSVSGVYQDTIPNTIGCDSLLTINVTINYDSSVSVIDTVCDSYTVPSGDETYFNSGIYPDTILSVHGCDSLLTINVTIYYTTSNTITDTVCNSYTVPSGDETYTASGIYPDTIPNYRGCDSLLTINLTVYHDSSVSITDTVCDSYTVPSGNETYTSTGIYQDTIPTNRGCDSLITINLTVYHDTSVSSWDTACLTYTVPSGDETYTISGIYQDTIPTARGCDSILTINLTVNQDSSYSYSDMDCNSYTVPSGDETYFISGIYQDTVLNATGCDSILTINVTVNFSSSASIFDTACNSYTVPSGDETHMISGIYPDTILNSTGCDSVLTINLTIKQNSSGSITDSVCDSYTVPSGDETYTISGIYPDTVPSSKGCDSLLTINLTVKHSTSNSIGDTVCNSYTVPSGDETYVLSGVYQDTVLNSQGCDSLLTINLTVNHNSSDTITNAVCISYTVPSGDETYFVSGIYPDTIPNSKGCDSLLTIDLTIDQHSSESITDTVCNSYTVPSGDETYTISGVYPDTIPSAKGCDSVLTINLTVNQNSSASITDTVCNSYTVPSGDETYTVSGIYPDTIPNDRGCDSLLTIDVTINHNSSESISEITCDSYTVPSGDETYTVNGIYQDTIPNYKGCDSLLSITLTVIHVDNSVTQIGDTLRSNATAVDYQWLDCSNSYAIIPVATLQIYLAKISGNYAVEITENDCVDTSDCYSIEITGIIENTFGEGLKIYPNPTLGNILVELGSMYEDVTVKITDISGQLIQQKTYSSINNFELNMDGLMGVYFIDISNNELKAIVRVLKYQ